MLKRVEDQNNEIDSDDDEDDEEGRLICGNYLLIYQSLLLILDVTFH